MRTVQYWHTRTKVSAANALLFVGAGFGFLNPRPSTHDVERTVSQMYSMSSEVPSTPTSSSSVTPITITSTPSTTRRSARVHKRDPIIAPGFGTQQDLDTLANDLGQPVAVVQAIMASQGRGTRRRGQPAVADAHNDATAATSAPAVVNSAWANFLSEEHTSSVEPSASGDAASTRTGTGTGTDRSTGNRTKPTEASASASDIRTYILPLVPSWSQQKPKSKKAKTNSTATVGGVLVQAGTLDASCIGRTKIAMDRAFDLKVPSILLPRLKVTKVISSCNAAHALAIDTSGKVYGWGRNETNQLGSGLGSYVGRPFLLEGLDQIIVGGAVGKSHSMVLTQNQELWAVGSNKVGQCGIKSSMDPVMNFRKCVLDDNVVQVRIALSCIDVLFVCVCLLS